MSPTLDDIAAAHRLIDQGWVAEKPMFFVNIPSVLDPSMRVDGGKHVLSVETLYTPYSLVGGWEGSDEPQRWLRALASLLSNDFLESVERWRVMTPCSYEREFNLPRGHATSFGGSAAVGDARPSTRAHALRDTDQGPLPHRRGHVSRCRGVGRGRPQHRHRHPPGR